MKSTPAHLVAAALFGVLVSTISGAWGQTTRPAAAPASRPTVQTPAALIALEGTVDDTMQRRLRRNVQDARALGAKTIIFQIDTYGGLSSAGLNISRFIKGLSDVQTIAYVNDKAISAGTMIALACDQIVMAPSAVIGDCAPISIGSRGELQPLPPTE